MKAILIDDESLALDFLDRQINKIGGVEVVGTFTNFDMNTHNKLLENIDIVFLDIEMPGINGLELAEKLLEVDTTLSIVFVTAFNNYAVQAFELNALDYILKPVQLERLEKTLNRIKKNKEAQDKKPVASANDIRVHVCRELRFQLEEDQFEIVPWRTAKAQELFLYLLQHHGSTVRKSVLAELLWPDFEQSKAYAQLYTAIYHIRQALNTFHDHFSIKNRQEGYVLFFKNAHIDIVKWQEDIEASPPINRQTIDHYETTMDLYTGPYLEEYDYIWAEPKRYHYEQLWSKTAYEMADCYVEHDELEKAVEWYNKICTSQPEDEKAHFSLMKLYASLNYGLLVTHQYEQLKNDLKDLELTISPQIQSWYNDWNESKKTF